MVARKPFFVGLVPLVAAAGLPLLGASLARRDLSGLWRFPPLLEIPTDYPRFSYPAVTVVFAILLLVLAPWLQSTSRRRACAAEVTNGIRELNQISRTFPKEGFLGFAWVIAWWLLSWTRFPWFSWGQPYTFFPLWLGFIVVVEACAEARGADVLRRRAPRRWLALFAVSAGFWWLFEWLNRFVHNWHYLGVADFGPLQYVLNASLCFSTVLPAVAAVRALLGTWPSLQTCLSAGPRWKWLERPLVKNLFLALGGGGLLLTGIWPQLFYPLLWTGPLLLALGLDRFHQDDGFNIEMAAGDWCEPGSWALAALVCGFFWELWNFYSQAKWIYTVPYVDVAHVFEMPIPGFAGYLPFGLECGLIARAFRASDEK